MNESFKINLNKISKSQHMFTFKHKDSQIFVYFYQFNIIDCIFTQSNVYKTPYLNPFKAGSYRFKNFKTQF
jgi:hypothetical protein